MKIHNGKEQKMEIKGYKVFNSDWTCREFLYEVGATYEEYESPILCNRGFHFCEKAADCFRYYNFDPKNKVAEVLALGDVDTDGIKSCTNKIQIVREIPWGELLELANTGKGCAGLWNSGNYNSGNHNSGNRNSGDWNSGDWNSGNCNSGDWNSGERNSGNRNSGNCNSGDWNKCNFSNGCFNTDEPKIYLFNKPSEWTYWDWLNSKAWRLLNKIPGDVLEYVCFSGMTDKERETHPEAETTGGYLKRLDNSECGKIWWRRLSDAEKEIIKGIPNFDAAIFKEITGVDVSE